MQQRRSDSALDLERPRVWVAEPDETSGLVQGRWVDAIAVDQRHPTDEVPNQGSTPDNAAATAIGAAPDNAAATAIGAASDNAAATAIGAAPDASLGLTTTPPAPSMAGHSELGPTAPVMQSRADRRNVVVLTVVIAWIPAVLYLDRTASGGSQLLLGIATWSLLLLILRAEKGEVRLQAAVVVSFATLVEYTFSAGLHVYDYRLGHVPAYVPPGHGLVYLGALCFGRLLATSPKAQYLVWGVVVAGGGYSAWGLFLSVHPDVLGAFWYLCLVAFLFLGRSRFLYVGAFIIVTYLEIIGTRWGVWTWHRVDPTGLVQIGNPPTGAAGGYGWFDLAAIYVSTSWFRRRDLGPDDVTSVRTT